MIVRLAFIWAIGGGLALLFSAPAYSATPDPVISKVWYEPVLVVDKDPHCGSILSAAKQRFGTTQDWTDAAGPLADDITDLKSVSSDGGIDDPAFTPDPDDTSRFNATLPGEKPLGLSFRRNSGCGGACDTISVEISQAPDAKQGMAQRASTPASAAWALYKSDNGQSHYVLGLVDNRLEVYRVTAPKDFKLSCSVALAPLPQEMSHDPAVTAALKAVESLDAAAKGMTRTGGDCGTMAAGYLNEQSMEAALKESLFRPWAVTLPNFWPQNVGSQGAYDETLSQLTKWSLAGTSETNALLRYRTQFDVTQTILTEFFVKKFGWPRDDARRMSAKSLQAAVIRGFAFPSAGYDPFPGAETQLRTALQEHWPLSKIETIKFDVATLDGAEKDSVLNVALGYKEALSYLLGKKLNPNQANAFGKTPLMYAAQANQLEAAKLLLAAGADPNAHTFYPNDQCEYALRTTGATPLHYAVRYASGDMIRLLVKAGAITFLKAGNNQSEETPLDWLRRYTAASAKAERNPFIQPGETAALSRLLHVPDEAELIRISRARILNAEASYTKGKIDAAYRATQLALAAEPDNQKALSDLPLLAFKTGRTGEAARDADNSIRALKSIPAQANAWFDMGLICQQVRYGIQYDGAWYCIGRHIDPFVHAFQLQATPSRQKKLLDVLQISDTDGCMIGTRQYKFEFILEGDTPSHEAPERIYILSSANDKIDPYSIQLTVKDWNMQTPVIQYPRLVDRYELGDRTLTLLESHSAPTHISIDGNVCGK